MTVSLVALTPCRPIPSHGLGSGFPGCEDDLYSGVSVRGALSGTFGADCSNLDGEYDVVLFIGEESSG